MSSKLTNECTTNQNLTLQRRSALEHHNTSQAQQPTSCTCRCHSIKIPVYTCGCPNESTCPRARVHTREKSTPQAISLTSESAAMCTGTSASSRARLPPPSPSWPHEAPPQPNTSPFSKRNSVCTFPVATLTRRCCAVQVGGTSTGA
jgi:hypothetical protein